MVLVAISWRIKLECVWSNICPTEWQRMVLRKKYCRLWWIRFLQQELPSSSSLFLYPPAKSLGMVLLTMGYQQHCNILRGVTKMGFILNNWTAREGKGERTGHSCETENNPCIAGRQNLKIIQYRHPILQLLWGHRLLFTMWMQCFIQQDFDPQLELLETL